MLKTLSAVLLKAALEKSEQVNELLKTNVEATQQARIDGGCNGKPEGGDTGRARGAKL